MSTSRERGDRPADRRKMFWCLLTLVLAVGGMAVTYTPSVSSALVPASPTSNLHPAALLWNPLTITALSWSSSPSYIGNSTTLFTTASGGQPWGGNPCSSACYNYSYSGLPTGCSNANTSSITCSPSATGTFTTIVTVSDAGGNVTKNAVQVTVDAFTITSFTETPSTVALGSSISFSTTYAGNVGTVTWTWTNLPSGCTAPAGKTLTCTPSVAGSFTVTLNGVDTSGATNSLSASFTVTPVKITSFTDSPSAIYTGQSTTFTTSITGTTGTVSYAYTGLPTGSSGCLSQDLASWTCVPRVHGTFTVKVTVTDSAGDTATATTTLTVSGLTITSFTASRNPTYQLVPTTLAVTAFGWLGMVSGGVGGAGYPIYSYTGLPTGCASANSSSLVCDPTVSGSFSLTATVSDPSGNSTTATLTLSVLVAVQPALYAPIDTAVQTQASTTEHCTTTASPPFYATTCDPQAQDPSVFGLPGGVTALAYALDTNSTTTSCLGPAAQTVSRIIFARSTNNGTSFTSKVNLGPNGCADLNAIEPSFAANSAGDIYGVFVMENSTALPNLYTSRAADALGFVDSTTGGATFASFSAVTTLDSSGNIAVPAIAASGSDIYVVYEDIANSSTAISGGVLPISVKFIASTDGGSTWSTPIVLPGLNSAEGYNAMNPSIAVSTSGEIAVAYATDRTCLTPGAATCFEYGSEVVVVTSSDQGLVWSAPSVASQSIPSNPKTNSVSAFTGESTCYAGVCQAAFFQSLPDTAIAFSSTGKMFVAWSGTINNTATLKSNLWWRWSGVGVVGSADNGASWTGGLVAAPNSGGLSGSTGNRSNYYRPALGIQGSTLYLTYSEDNETNTTAGVGALYPGPFDNSLSQWGDNATIASAASSASLAWVNPAPQAIVSVPSGRLTNFTGNSFTGYHSSIGFTSAGVVLEAFAIAQLPVSTVASKAGYYSDNITYGTSLEIYALAVAGLPEVVPITVASSGLPTGTPWTISLDGQTISSTLANLLIINVPKGVTIYQNLSQLSALSGWGYDLAQLPVVPATAVYESASTLNLAYTIFVYYNYSFAPQLGPSFSTAACNPSSGYCFAYGDESTTIYECLDVPGYTCDSAPANPTAYGYTTYCEYYEQIGCYYQGMSDFWEIEYGPGYVYDYLSMEQELIWYTASGEQSNYMYNYCYSNGGPTGCASGQDAYDDYVSCVYPTVLPIQDIGYSCYAGGINLGTWLPIGFTVAGGAMYTYDNEWYSEPNYPSDFNGTGPDAYNGVSVSACLAGTTNSDYNPYDEYCPEAYYLYYYYGIYYPYECLYGSPNEDCTGAPPMTLTAPLNETGWYLPSTCATCGPGGGLSGYTVDLIPKGIPSGTPYGFDLAGKQYRLTAPNSLILTDQPSETLSLTDAYANSTVSGWKYYSPAQSITVGGTAAIFYINFSALVDLNLPAQPMTITAENLTAGISWIAELNGTTYTQSTPTLTVSLRPGLYILGSFAVNSTDGQTEYTPPAAQTVNLTTATSFDLSFVPAYRVVVTSSSGGTVQINTGKASSGGTAFYKTGAQIDLTATPASGYEFVGFTGSGPGSYTGTGNQVGSQYTTTVTVSGPMTEGVSFAVLPAERYSITFVSNNLPAGIWWTVLLDGIGYSSNTSTLTVNNLYPHTAGALGTYKMLVADAYANGTSGIRYIPSGYPATTWANATGTTMVHVTWSEQYAVTLAATDGGSVAGSIGSLAIGSGTTWEPYGETIAVVATPNNGYQFLSWNGTGPGSNSSATPTLSFVVTGPITEIAQFGLIPSVTVPTYTETFRIATAMESGTSWTITLKNATETWQFSSVTTTLNATGLETGSYTLSVKDAYAPDGLTRYIPNNPPVSISLNGRNGSEQLSFVTQYWVSIESSSGGQVTATLGAASTASLQGWYAHTTLIVTANATGNNLFETWVGTGAGSYSGDEPSASVTVSGPIQEVAEFEPPAPVAIQKGGFFSTAPSWGIFAVIGLVVGLAIGVVAFRRRRPPASDMASAPSVPDTTYGMSGPSGGSMMGSDAGEAEPGAPKDNPGADQ